MPTTVFKRFEHYIASVVETEIFKTQVVVTAYRYHRQQYLLDTGPVRHRVCCDVSDSF